MCCLRNNGNYLHLKHLRLGWKTQAEIDQGKYNGVWYEIVTPQNGTAIRLKGRTIITAHRRGVSIADKYLTKV